MFNISSFTTIKNIDKAKCSTGHIVACLHDRTKHDAPQYSYYGDEVSKGTVLLHTCNGDFTLKFDEKNGWARAVEIL